MQTPTVSTVPNPADRDQPVAPPSPLAAIALAQGVDRDLVAAYVAHRAVPAYRLVATIVGLAQVQS